MENNKLKIFTVLTSSNMNSNHFVTRKTMKEELFQAMTQFGADVRRIASRKLEHQNEEKLEEGTNSKCIHGLFGPFAIFICIASTFGVMLLPTHNIFLNPECWYELTFSTTLFYLFASTVVAIETEACVSPFNKGTFKAIKDLFVCSKSAEIAVLFFMHLIWTEILGRFEPVPYRMIISFYVSMVCLAVRLWAIIPRQNSKGEKLRKKCKPLLYRYLWSQHL